MRVEVNADFSDCRRGARLPGRAGREGGGVRFTGYSSGSVRVDGVTYDHDLIIDRGKIRKRNKAGSMSVGPSGIWQCSAPAESAG
jgi:hypothetical protein